MVHEIIAHLGGALGQFFIDQHVDRGHGHGAAQGVAAEGGAVGAGLEDAEHVLVGGHGADREYPAAQGLAHDDDVGIDILMLVGEQLAGAAKAGLDLVHGQQDVVLLGDEPQPFRKPSSGTTTPASPWMGSTRMPTVFLLTAFSTAFRSL